MMIGKANKKNTLDIDYAFEYRSQKTKHNGIKIDCLYLYNMNSTQIQMEQELSFRNGNDLIYG